MFESLFNAIEKFVNDFSWRRLFTWLIVLIVIICSAWTLEYYTGYLRLARIDKTIELLKKLSDLQEIQRSSADFCAGTRRSYKIGQIRPDTLVDIA